MKKYYLKIRESDKIFFEVIKNGIKTVDTRAATKKFQHIKKEDILVFVCGNKKIEKKIKQIDYFQNIEDLVKKIDFKKIMPFVSSLKEAKKVWYSFPNYKKKISNFGIIAFHLE